MSGFEKCRNRTYVKEYKEKQWNLDREKKLHSPELYAVWNLKHYLLNEIARQNPFKSKFFIYTDCGAWRNRSFTNWPDNEFVDKVAAKIGDRILYGQVGMSEFRFKNDTIQGLNYFNFKFI